MPSITSFETTPNFVYVVFDASSGKTRSYFSHETFVKGVADGCARNGTVVVRYNDGGVKTDLTEFCHKFEQDVVNNQAELFSNFDPWHSYTAEERKQNAKLAAKLSKELRARIAYELTSQF